MHQLNVRLDDDLFRDLRTAYAREIERRAALPRAAHFPWSAFVRDCIRAGIERRKAMPTQEQVQAAMPHGAAASWLNRAERRRLQRNRR